MAAAGDDPSIAAAVLQQALATGICLGLPSVSLAIQSGNKSLIWSGADYQQQRGDCAGAGSNRSSFCIGSITKTLVAVVVLQLADEKKLHLDDTALRYLTSSSTQTTALVSRVPNADRATLRQLLCHQSGVPTWEFRPDWIRAGRGAGIVADKVWGKQETLQYVARDNDDDTSPGERFSYSNSNYTILGLVIESVTGHTATAEIRRRILEPLGLKSAYLESFEAPPLDNYQLTRHYHYATQQFVDTAGMSDLFVQTPPSCHRYLVDTSAANLSTEWVAGGMVMSMPDLAVFAKALRDGRLLSPEMMRELLTYHPPSRDEMGQDSAGRRGRSLEESGQQYCHGVCRTVHHREEKDGRSLVSYGHGGRTLGFCAQMFWLEEHDVVVACATNVGVMHSGFPEGASPWDLFLSSVLMPALEEYLTRKRTLSDDKTR